MRPMALSGRKESKNLIVGLDIGTSKIAAIVAEMRPEGGFEVIGMGSSPSRGLKKGVVVYIDATVHAIPRALEEKVHIVRGAVSAAQNIMKCVRRCGLEVNDLILQPIASATAVLSEDERGLGVCLVDIGGGTSDIAVFTQGAIRHTAVIPIAGDQITNDIAMALRTPTKAA